MTRQGILLFISGILTASLLVFLYVALYPNSASNLIAVSTGTTQQKPSEEEVAATGGVNTIAAPTQPQKVWVKDHYEYIVTFNNGAFNPPVLTIKKGETIQFVNKDNLAMRVSVAYQGTPASTIVDPNVVSKGGSYSFMFSKSGTYVISNIDGALNPGGGVVNVVD